MAYWDGFGINYAHHLTSYDEGVVASELEFISRFTKKIRIAMPNYDSVIAQPGLKQIVSYALSKGFYVIFGTVSGGYPINSTTWTANLASKTALIDWAQSVGLSELSLGNEEELHCDGTTLTQATVITDMKALATTAQSSFSGVISYTASQQQISAWVTAGKGDLDRLCFNVYGNQTTFKADVTSIVSNFGSNAYIGEFGTSNGYTDFTNEQAWARELAYRKKYIIDAGISEAYYFGFKDGTLNGANDKWGLKLDSGNYRIATPRVLGKRDWFII